MKSTARNRLHEATFLLVRLELGDTADTGPVLDLLRELAGESDLPDSDRSLLMQAVELLESGSGDGPPAPPVLKQVSDLLDGIADDGRDPAEADLQHDPGVTAEILAGFVAETLESLESAERAALELESAPGDGRAIDALFRCFHSIKGTAGFLSLTDIVELSHRAESLLSLVREGRRSAGAAETDLVLQSVDILRQMVSGVGGRSEAEVEWQGLGAALDSLVASAPAPTTRTRDSGRDPADATAQHADEERFGARAATEWTRVRTDRLDTLIEGLGELLVAQSILGQDPALQAAQHSQLGQKMAASGKILRELQQLAVSMRTIPLAGLFGKTARLVRELARAKGRPLNLALEGEDTEIDRNMVDLLSDPVLHMIRNSVDHGIETPAERRAAGKPEVGSLRLRASSSGSEVVVELSDDGRGLDRDRIRSKAVERGLLHPDEEVPDGELLRMIFQPGFSTASEVTDLSGRGVGMDVVRRNIESMHGRLEIESEAGSGTTITLRLPLTLAITDGLIVTVGGERFVLPSRHVHLSFRPDKTAVQLEPGNERVTLKDREMPLIRLHELLGVGEARREPSDAVVVVVWSGAGGRGLLVDEVLAQTQVVSKPLGLLLATVPWLSGGAILSDGRVGLVLDVPAIAATADDRPGNPAPVETAS